MWQYLGGIGSACEGRFQALDLRAPLYLKWIEERFPKPSIPVQFRAGVPFPNESAPIRAVAVI